MAWFWGRSAAARAAEEEEARRRLRVRPRADQPVVVHVVGRQSIDIFAARDVSQTGLGLFVAHGFEGCDLEAGVELVVTLPGERAFSARGQVMHRTIAGDDSLFFGVHFTALADDHRARIERYVERRLEEDAAPSVRLAPTEPS